MWDVDIVQIENNVFIYQEISSNHVEAYISKQ